MTTNSNSVKDALKIQSEKRAKLSPTEQMRSLLLRMSDEIARALPENIKSERFQRVVLTAFSNNPKLQQCNAVSFLAAMMQAAQLGLEPNTPLGQAYLIPYGNNVQFQLGYKGLIDLAMRTGAYESIYAHAVHENDEFDLDYGLNQKLQHKPLLTGDRGRVIGYYAVYKLTNGGYGFAYMTREEVEAHAKKFSKSYSSGPWKSDFDAMAKKTVIKQALKYAPMSIEIQRATSIDDHVMDSGKAEDAIEHDIIDTAWEMTPEEEEAPAPAPEQGPEIPPSDFLGDDFKPIEFDESKKA